MRTPPIVKLRGVVSLIGRFPALAGVDVEILPGSIVVLKGPNGAGKTTLLRLCAGLAPIHEGHGEVLGTDLTSREGRRLVRRQVGILGHGAGLYEDLTVRQNLEFWVKANRGDLAMIEPVMAHLGLAGRLGSVPVSGLSAGQRRRTSMAILVCRRPKLWLLDEPHAGFDPEGRDLVDSLVGDAVASGATAVVASHDLDRAEQLAHRVLTVVGGQISQDRPGGAGVR